MRLRILSLNVWGLPWRLARDTGLRMHAIAGQLSELAADVVCLQEIWTQGDREILLQGARRAGLTHIWHRPAALGGSGLLVCSRLPISAAHFGRFRLAGLPQRVHHADYFGGKGYAILTLETDAGPLAVLATHLHAGYVDAGETDEYAGMRVAQVVEIAHALRAVASPVIAAGDFNMQEGAPEYEILTGLTGLVDSAARLERRQPSCLAPHPYRAENAVEERIDFIFARAGAERDAVPREIQRVLDQPIEAEGGPQAYSDHAGLLAEIEIRPRATSTESRAEPAEDSLEAAAERADDYLARGRTVARERQHSERRWAASGLLVALLGGAGAQRARRERRTVLHAGLMTLAGLGLGAGSGLAALSEHFVRDELRGYDEVEQLLATLRADRRPLGEA